MNKRFLGLGAALVAAAVAACGGDETGTGSTSGADGGGGAASSTSASSTSTTASNTSSTSSNGGGGAGSSSTSSSTSDGGAGSTSTASATSTSSGGVSQVVAGIGTITGECPAFAAADYTSATGSLVRNSVALNGAAFDATALTAGGKAMLQEAGTPDSVGRSEIYSYEILHACEGVTLEKTSGAIAYTATNGKKTDYSVKAGATKLGVNAARAYTPADVTFDAAAAKTLLEKQLLAIKDSTANVAKADAWAKQFLHVIAFTIDHADKVEAAYGALDAATKGDTLVVVTVTEGTDEYLYTGK